MRTYHSIVSQQDMDNLLASIAGFHDSMTKEIHLVNRGYVQPDKSMMMGHRFDAQVLIQSQWEPFAVELLFSDIQDLHLGDPGEYWDACGSVEVITTPVEDRRISMSFDSALTIVCKDLSYRVRSDWLGQKAFLTTEIPSEAAIAAHVLRDNWRQCSSCKDAWQEEPSREFSYCPNCGELTELQVQDC
jgi:predicted RNA-binding Zn-ribbon protein involved in translation (DUF1610 family)